MRVKCWKVAYWNAQRLLKNGQKSKKLLLKFKTCCQNFCILLHKRQFKAFFLVVHNNYFHRSRKVIFGMNTTSDISKLLYVISRAVRRVKFGTIWKYHEQDKRSYQVHLPQFPLGRQGDRGDLNPPAPILQRMHIQLVLKRKLCQLQGRPENPA